jgi:hypothetical protein
MLTFLQLLQQLATPSPPLAGSGVDPMLQFLSSNDMGLGAMAGNPLLERGIGLGQTSVRFNPNVALDASQVRDWRGDRNPFAAWLSPQVNSGSFFDGPNPHNGYPWGPWFDRVTQEAGRPY